MHAPHWVLASKAVGMATAPTNGSLLESITVDDSSMKSGIVPRRPLSYAGFNEWSGFYSKVMGSQVLLELLMI